MTPAERKEKIERVLREKRAELQALEALPAPTKRKSCMYCEFGPIDRSKGSCRHPAHRRARANEQTGVAEIVGAISTIIARDDDGLCGPEALLYQSRPAIQRFWRWLLLPPR